jgi:integration host factor subunit beta
LKERKKMTRSELIAKVAASFSDLTYAQVKEIVCKIFDYITDALGEGCRVELRGFGTFSIRQREMRQGRNPRTSEPVLIPAKNIPFFKTGKNLRDILNA